MNKERRKTYIDVLNKLRALVENLEPCSEAEREAFDNKPESLQTEEAEAMAEGLETALESVNAAIEALEEVEGNDNG